LTNVETQQPVGLESPARIHRAHINVLVRQVKS